jgi:hypothetical protein
MLTGALKVSTGHAERRGLHAPFERGNKLISRHARPAIGVGEDRCSSFCKRTVSVGMIEMPMRANQAARRLMRH